MSTTPIDVSTNGSVSSVAGVDYNDEQFFTFTPSSEFLVFSTDHPDDLYFEIYKGTGWDDYDYVGWSYGGQAFELENGIPHFVATYPFGDIGAGTPFTLSWERASSPSAGYVVSNDDFASPIPLSLTESGSGSITYDNTGATEDHAPGREGDGTTRRSIWFSIAPLADSTILRFNYTPSGPEASKVPSAYLYRWDGTTATWTSLYSTLGQRRVILEAGAEYRLVLFFLDGTIGPWETEGQLSWETEPPPDNTDPAFAPDVTSSGSFYLPATGYVNTWIKVVSPGDGGLMMVFGDGSSPRPAGVSSMIGNVYRDPSSPLSLGSFGWVATEVAGNSKFVIRATEGETFYVRVTTNGWPGGPVPLRIGLSTEITGWSEWINADNIRAEESPTGKPLPPYQVPYTYRSSAPNVPGSDYYTQGVGWRSSVGTDTPGHSNPWDGDFLGARAMAEGGTNHATRSKPPRDSSVLGSGTMSPAGPPSMYPTSGIGTPTPEYDFRFQQGPMYWTVNGNLDGDSFAQNNVTVRNSAINEGLAYYNNALENAASLVPTFDDWLWWIAHWPLFYHRTDIGITSGSQSSMRTRIQAMAVEWSEPFDGFPEVEVWTRTTYSWGKNVGTPWIGGVSHTPPDTFTVELRKGPTFKNAPPDSWVDPGEMAALPIVEEVDVPASPGSGSGYIETEYHFDYAKDTVHELGEIDWNAWWDSTPENPHLFAEAAVYRTLSFFTRNDPIDTGRIIATHHALNGYGAGGDPFVNFRGAIDRNIDLRATYPSHFRVGTYAETWELPGQDHPIRLRNRGDALGLGAPRLRGRRSRQKSSSLRSFL